MKDPSFYLSLWLHEEDGKNCSSMLIYGNSDLCVFWCMNSASKRTIRSSWRIRPRLLLDEGGVDGLRGGKGMHFGG